jgi:hypothetical protein
MEAIALNAAALNREYGGRVQEQVGSLDRMRERLA